MIERTSKACTWDNCRRGDISAHKTEIHHCPLTIVARHCLSRKARVCSAQQIHINWQGLTYSIGLSPHWAAGLSAMSGKVSKNRNPCAKSSHKIYVTLSLTRSCDVHCDQWMKQVSESDVVDSLCISTYLKCIFLVQSDTFRRTCEASRFDSNSNRTSRFDSKVTGRFENFESLCCDVCRRTINNTHCSTTNFNHFGIAIGIYIEFN